MLKNYFIKYYNFRFIQTGFLLDFFIKKISEIFIRNIFIYSSLLFGEKYIIEYITRKFINNILYNLNKDSFNSTNYIKFFLEIFIIIFSILFLILYIIFFL